MVADNLARDYVETVQSEIVINENPLKWSTISLSDVISRGKRLEARVFDVEAKQAWEHIVKGKYGSVPLYGDNGLINNASYPGRFKRIYCDKQNGVGFYLPSQMTDIYPKPEKYISKLTKCNIEELRLRPKTLLLTRSGTIGTISYVSKTIENCVFSDDVIRVTFKKDCDLGYVYTFLKSKIGNLILKTNGYGSVITHLEPDHLEEIRIPNAPFTLRMRINDLVERSYALRDESNEIIDEATRLLVEELKLPHIQELQQIDKPINTFSVKLSSLNLRLDASYHVPIVDAITVHLREHAAEVTTIGDSRISEKIILAGVFKRTYVEEEHGFPFLGGKEITQLNPKTEKYLSKQIHRARYEKELKVTENIILITNRGTIGISALVPRHWNGYAVSQNVLKVIPASKDIAGYTYIYLNSTIGQYLMRRQTYGSVVDMIDNYSLSSVEIPFLKNQATQKRINDLALSANSKRYEAYKLEQEALRIMNDEVINAK